MNFRWIRRLSNIQLILGEGDTTAGTKPIGKGAEEGRAGA
jgi:hypothetical protein